MPYLELTKQKLVAAIRAQNPTYAALLADLAITSPVTNTEQVYTGNTLATVNVPNSTEVVGTTLIGYDRVDLDKLGTWLNHCIRLPENATTLTQLVAALASYHRCVVDASDLTCEFTIVDDKPYVTITAVADAISWTGTTTLQVIPISPVVDFSGWDIDGFLAVETVEIIQVTPA